MSPSICRRCDTPLEAGDLRCAICGEAAAETTAPSEVQVKVLRCQGCGATMTYDAEVGAVACAFCDSLMHLEEISDPTEQSAGHLPFLVSESEAREALRAWQSSLGWFRPSDLRSTARIEGLRPLFWVAWVFDATALISWAADSDAGSRRSDWAPHAGQTEMVFDDIVVSASRGLSAAETDRLTLSYRVDSLLDSPPADDTRPGLVIEHFDVQRSAARRRILSGIDRVAAQRVQAEHIPGSRFRKVRTEALLRGLVTRRLSLPAYVLAYRYKHKLYRAVVSGQDATCIQGDAPYSTLKIALVIAIGVTLIALFALAITS